MQTHYLRITFLRRNVMSLHACRTFHLRNYLTELEKLYKAKLLTLLLFISTTTRVLTLIALVCTLNRLVYGLNKQAINKQVMVRTAVTAITILKEAFVAHFLSKHIQNTSNKHLTFCVSHRIWTNRLQILMLSAWQQWQRVGPTKVTNKVWVFVRSWQCLVYNCLRVTADKTPTSHLVFTGTPCTDYVSTFSDTFRCLLWRRRGFTTNRTRWRCADMCWRHADMW